MVKGATFWHNYLQYFINLYLSRLQLVLMNSSKSDQNFDIYHILHSTSIQLNVNFWFVNINWSFGCSYLYGNRVLRLECITCDHVPQLKPSNSLLMSPLQRWHLSFSICIVLYHKTSLHLHNWSHLKCHKVEFMEYGSYMSFMVWIVWLGCRINHQTQQQLS